MFLELTGNYFVRFQIGGELIAINPSSIDELYVIQDVNRMVPSFRFKFKDTMGVLTHFIPFDNQFRNARMEIGKTIGEDISTAFDFKILRRKPESNYASTTDFDIYGLLDIPRMITPTYSRSWNDSIRTILTDIAINELKCDSVDISQSLDYQKLIVQGDISNANLLSDLKSRLIGKNSECCFKTFIKIEDKKKVFVCKSIDEFYKTDVKYKFSISDSIYQDTQSGSIIYPIFDYSIIDNVIVSPKQQNYSYFDYTTGTQIESTKDYTSFFSLSEKYLVDGNDDTYSVRISDLGRSNDFTSNFDGDVYARYHDYLSNLTQMWIQTVGLPTITPGSIILIIFNQGMTDGNMLSYAYGGYWFVERVIHTVGDTLKTRLFLSRNGIDTEIDTTLIKANNKRTKLKNFN